jgi:LmbE family N-acetylglucosaminyl deacetylase
MKKKILIIEPHSDDGIIAAGGFLEKFRSKYEYFFVLISASNIPLNHQNFQSRENRIDEFINYVNFFNGKFIDSTNYDVDFPYDKDAELDLLSKKILVKQIEKVIDIVRPNILMCTGPSFHQDHTIVFESTIAATRPTALYYPDEFYILENPTYVHSSSPLTDFKPDTYVILSEEEIDKKIKTFQNLFPSQIRTHGNSLSSSGIKSWARYRGIEARADYAEAFQTFSRHI